MPITAEVFAYPEGSLRVFPAGGPSSVLLYIENVKGRVEWEYIKYKNQLTGGFAARTHFQLADKNVTVNFGQLFYENSNFLAANSATAFNAVIGFSAAGGKPNTAEFQIWSAVFTEYGIEGREGDLFRTTVGMRAADISGV